MEDIKAIIEALLLASETPLSIERIRDVLPDIEKKKIQQIIEELIQDYETQKRGFMPQAVAGGYQFRTRADFAPWIRKLRGSRASAISPAALETLAVIAYRQPIVKAEIDKIRGVDVSGALKGLLEKKLVRIMGRKDVPGKPIIYGTTKKFLEVFNLNDLSELPTLRELKDLEQQRIDHLLRDQDIGPDDLQGPETISHDATQESQAAGEMQDPLSWQADPVIQKKAANDTEEQYPEEGFMSSEE
jgi:segregation and condensation protein B